MRDALNRVPRTIFTDPAKPRALYDQIAWFKSASGVKKLAMDYVSAEYVDFVPHVYQDQSFTQQSISFQVSDHFPLWAEFEIG